MLVVGDEADLTGQRKGEDLRNKQKEMKQSHVHHRQSTHHISLGGDKDDGYVIPTSVSHSTIGKKPQPKPIFHGLKGLGV
ncbi:hypothetical protein E2C01_025337 [Portunus trituberculatus]|uniref:Uncharacterized protein n=1 Tax=Portunus trituberculatus TaxID=210409 RepID=A0A5B7EF82_PORTR|nr:hypothetical protein [Portunus trituberculatus]